STSPLSTLSLHDALPIYKKVKKNQGLIYAFVQTGWPVGALLAAGFVTLVTMWFGPDSWRMAFLISIIPAAVVFVLIFVFLKETPDRKSTRLNSSHVSISY